MSSLARSTTLLLGALLATATLTWADGTCVNACRTARAGCLARARSERAAMRADCRDLGGQVSCLTSATARAHTLVNDCRAAMSTCRVCCNDGGPSQKCASSCD